MCEGKLSSAENIDCDVLVRSPGLEGCISRLSGPFWMMTAPTYRASPSVQHELLGEGWVILDLACAFWEWVWRR